jgi:hypothetical protein
MLEIGEEEVGIQARQILFAMGSGREERDGETRRPGSSEVVRRISDKQCFSRGGSQDPESFEDHVGSRFFRESVSFSDDACHHALESEMIRNPPGGVSFFVGDDACRDSLTSELPEQVSRSWQGKGLVEYDPVVMLAEKENAFIRFFLRDNTTKRVPEGRSDDLQHFLPREGAVYGKRIENSLKGTVDGAEGIDKGAVEVEEDSFGKSPGKVHFRRKCREKETSGGVNVSNAS